MQFSIRGSLECVVTWDQIYPLSNEVKQLHQEIK